MCFNVSETNAKGIPFDSDSGGNSMSYLYYNEIVVDDSLSTLDIVLDKGKSYKDPSNGIDYYLYDSLKIATLVKLNETYEPTTVDFNGKSFDAFNLSEQDFTVPEYINGDYKVTFVGTATPSVVDFTKGIIHSEASDIYAHGSTYIANVYQRDGGPELSITFEGTVILNENVFIPETPLVNTGQSPSTVDTSQRLNFNVTFEKDVYVNSSFRSNGNVIPSSYVLNSLKSVSINGIFYGGLLEVPKKSYDAQVPGRGLYVLTNTHFDSITIWNKVNFDPTMTNTAKTPILKDSEIENLRVIQDSLFVLEERDPSGYNFENKSGTILAQVTEKSDAVLLTIVCMDKMDRLAVIKGNTKPLDSPSVSGMSFGGWFKDSDYTDPYNSEEALNENTTVYAKFTTTITFSDVTVTKGSETLTSPASVTYGTELSVEAVPRTGYTAEITGVTLVNGKFTVSGEATIGVTYTPIAYTYTFKNGEVTVGTVEFNVENMASKTMPEVPAKAGYTGSWDVTEFALEDKTVNAVYVKLAPVSENGTADVTLSDGETSFIPAAGTKTVNVEIAADTFVKVEDATGLANKVVVTKVDSVTNSTGIAGTAYEFTFTADGTVYNGKIQVTLPYTKEAGKEPAVYFWNGTDSVKMKVISSTDTSVTFETDHNSTYVVASETSSKDDGTSFMLYLSIILVVGIVAAMLVGFTFYRKKA